MSGARLGKGASHLHLRRETEKKKEDDEGGEDGEGRWMI
jgi:hypothetical protein